MPRVVPDERLWVEEILDAARSVLAYTQGLGSTALLSDALIRDAVAFRLGRIGQAALRLPDALMERHPEISWNGLRAMRDLVLPDYFAVDWEQIWSTVEHDLPPLLELLPPLLDADPTDSR